MLCLNRAFLPTFACLLLGSFGCTDPSVPKSPSASATGSPPAGVAQSSVETLEPLAEQVAEPNKLTIGSVAPKLQLAQWIQGKRVDGFRPGHTYVVEFWATWCRPCRVGMPHLSELQEQYADNVTFIGVTDEDEKRVQEFLGKTQNDKTGETWSDVVTYAIALDAGGATHHDYLRAAGQNGIPAAFVVGGDAHIEWIGHPAGIDKPLQQIVAGTWDRDEHLARFQEEQRQAEKMAMAMKSLQAALGDNDWERAIRKVDSLLEKYPSQFRLMLLKLSLLKHIEKFEEAVALAEQVAAENWENVNLLNALAWLLATEQSEPDSRLEVALRFAKRASELQQDGEAAILDTIARIYYEQGHLAEAIAWQEKAIALEQGVEGLEETLQKYLDEREGEASDSPAAPAASSKVDVTAETEEGGAIKAKEEAQQE